MLLGSIGSIAHPFYDAFAWLIAEFYNLIPNYAIAIALLTLTVMIVVFPITLKGTRAMMKMQLLAPEVKKLQTRYKASPGMSVEERQESRRALNEEMMALYRENNASPTGGCLPMFMQFPVFIILYGTIRGLTHRLPASKGHIGGVDPLYISHSSRIYHDISSANGALHAFGINLADSVRTTGLSWPTKIPYIALILVAIALQYIQMKQLNGRNPAAAAANPQMQQMQKIFPIIFAVIYISIPAGVNVYFIVSSMFRVAQQELMYRRDPHIQAAMSQLRARGTPAKPGSKVLDTTAVKSRGADGRRGILSRFLPTPALGDGSGGSVSGVPGPAPQSNGSNGSGRSSSRNGQNGRGQNGRGQNGRGQNGAKPAPDNRSQPRAAGKRQRRPR